MYVLFDLFLDFKNFTGYWLVHFEFLTKLETASCLALVKSSNFYF